MFVGGPCSQGPGMVVDDELKHPIRFVLSRSIHIGIGEKTHTECQLFLFRAMLKLTFLIKLSAFRVLPSFVYPPSQLSHTAILLVTPTYGS